MGESIANPLKPIKINTPVIAVTAMRFGAKKLVDEPPSITNNTASRTNSDNSNTTRTYRFFNCPALAAPTAHAAPTKNCHARVSGLKNANYWASILMRSKNDVPGCANT